ncbi:hypothetical protein AMATHDRAFT_1461 [Amanita thiersii Skay4041]|uniref:DNA polymerase n=1 Tax=Amanita thiersii Skay4041 TaxID=703135 RepID=A0A2A9NY74_9AGAR|nr:hypothetical protein AMATHDRAFT_1461 [Amanita thiersii Skay4041]
MSLLSLFTRQALCPARACLAYYSTSSTGINKAIIDMLKREQQTELELPERNPYKIKAFANAIRIIQNHQHPMSEEQAKRIKGIGTGIAQRISEFLSSQASAHSPESREKKRNLLIRKELMTVPSIGLTKAQKLVDNGCTSIEDLQSRKFQAMLTKKQKVLVKYFRHLNDPVMREQAEAVMKFMQDNLSSKYEVIIAGDYRRGRESLTAIEIILLHSDHVQIPVPDPPKVLRAQSRLKKSTACAAKYISAAKKIPNPLHGDAIPVLEARGLVCAMTTSGDRRWSGIIRIPELMEMVNINGTKEMIWASKDKRLSAIAIGEGFFRCLNVTIVPQKAKAASLLTLTGDSEFIKHTRRKALGLGLYLDEFGLWKWHSQPDAEPSSETIKPILGSNTDECGYWELMQVSTENDIFSLLGMEYVEPDRRNFGFLKSKKLHENIQ